MPGGGAEVFSERIRRETYHLKISGDEWLDIARKAHRAGVRSNCTMLHGHVETVEERVDHLDRLRRLQDETGGLRPLIPLSFHPKTAGWYASGPDGRRTSCARSRSGDCCSTTSRTSRPLGS